MERSMLEKWMLSLSILRRLFNFYKQASSKLEADYFLDAIGKSSYHKKA